MSNTPASSAFTPSGSTHMAIAEVDRIVVRGKDLCRDVIGQQSFTAYFLFLLTGETPSDNLVRVADATMVSLAEHGLVPSVQAARMTLAAAPESVQGAVAAGLLGCGPVILGASETAGHLLIEMLAQSTQQGQTLEDVARERLQAFRAAKQALPGFGHPVHKLGDPRATKLIELARQWGVAGAHVRALDALAQQRGQSLAQMAIAWVLRDPRMTSALIGASRPEQIVELVGALNNLTFTTEELATIDQHAVEGGINLWQRPSTDQRLG